jgi:hypothetical protein
MSKCRVWLVFLLQVALRGKPPMVVTVPIQPIYSSVLYYTVHPFDSHLHCIVVHYRVRLHASRRRVPVGVTAILEQSLCAARRRE